MYLRLFIKRGINIFKITCYIIISYFFISCESNSEIKFLPENLNIGEIKAGENKNIIAQLQNVGRDTLLIEHVSAGCHCTEVDINLKKVPPGGVTDLNFTYYADSEMKSNEQINVAIVVRSNTKNRLDEFYITGRVK